MWLDGLRTGDAPLWRLAERAGLVFQNPTAQMLGLSVEEEIIFGCAGTAVVVCEHRAEYLRQIPGLRTVHLDAPIESYPQQQDAI